MFFLLTLKRKYGIIISYKNYKIIEIFWLICIMTIKERGKENAEKGCVNVGGGIYDDSQYAGNCDGVGKQACV